jgi:hypothetical protein
MIKKVKISSTRQGLLDVEIALRDLVRATHETHLRLHGIENRLLEERADSQADIYQRISEMQKQMIQAQPTRRIRK